MKTDSTPKKRRRPRPRKPYIAELTDTLRETATYLSDATANAPLTRRTAALRNLADLVIEGLDCVWAIDHEEPGAEATEATAIYGALRQMLETRLHVLAHHTKRRPANVVGMLDWMRSTTLRLKDTNTRERTRAAER